MKFVKNQIRMSLKAILEILGIEVGAWVFGIVLCELIMKLFKPEENPTVFPLGTLFAMILLCANMIFFIMVLCVTNFNNAVGMGRTRKEYYLCFVIESFITNFFGYLLLLLLRVLEIRFLNLAYKGIAIETKMSMLNQVGIGTVIILAGVGLGTLFGALAMKYGKKIFWIIWVIWMLLCTGAPKIIERFFRFSAEGEKQVLEFLSGMTKMDWCIVGIVVALVFYGISWLIMRKQRVTG